MDKKRYLELLKDPRWIKKRNAILTRDKNTCQFCGCQHRYLHVHHKKYEKGKMPWEYDDDELIAICSECHGFVTEDSKNLYENFLYLRDSMRSFGFSDSVLNSLLSNLGTFFECYDEELLNKQAAIRLTELAVFGTQNYDDFRVLTKLGITHEDFIKEYIPKFLTDYQEIINKNKRNEQSKKDKE